MPMFVIQPIAYGSGEHPCAHQGEPAEFGK